MEMKKSLCGLPIDILSILGSILDGKSVVSLYKCGNKVLSAKLSVAVTEMYLQVGPFVKFPFSVFKWPKLRILAVETVEKGIAYPLVMGEPPCFPTKAITSLRKLIFRFAQSMDILSLPSCPLASFPNLSHLHLTGAIMIKGFKWIETLPATLRSLKLVATVDLVNRVCLPFKTLERLASVAPLEELWINGYLIGSMHDPYVLNLKFPDSLTRLTLAWVKSYKILLRLPKFAEQVSLPYLTCETGTEQLSISILPRSLTEFSISQFGGDVHFIVDTPFPPSMKRFSGRILWNSVSVAPTPSSQSTYFGQLFPSCMHTVIPQPPLAWSAAAVAKNEFHLSSLYLLSMSSELTNSQLSTFPTTLRSMALRISTDEQFKSIPHSLTKLVIETPPKLVATFSRESWSRLSGLEDLAVDMTLIGATEIFSLFPRLCSLRLTISGPCVSTNGRGAFSYVSTSLERLILQSDEVGHDEIRETWKDWLLDLPRLTCLSSMYISSNSPLGLPSPIHFLRELPSSLRTLSTIVDERHASDLSSFSHLPPHLTSLMLESPFHEDGNGDDLEISLKNEHFADLPQNLFTLRIERITGIDGGILPLLPDTLTNIFFPHILLIDQAPYLSEKRKQKWNGFHPSQLEYSL